MLDHFRALPEVIDCICTILSNLTVLKIKMNNEGNGGDTTFKFKTFLLIMKVGFAESNLLDPARKL